MTMKCMAPIFDVYCKLHYETEMADLALTYVHCLQVCLHVGRAFYGCHLGHLTASAHIFHSITTFGFVVSWALSMNHREG